MPFISGSSYTNLGELASELQHSVDHSEPVVLVQLQINQAPEVARLLQPEHIRAEEFLIHNIGSHIEQHFGDSNIYRLGKKTFLIWLNGITEEIQEKLMAFSAASASLQIFLNGKDYYPKLNIGATELADSVGESVSRLEYACGQAASAIANRYFYADINHPGAKKASELQKGLRQVRVALQSKNLGIHGQEIVPISAASGNGKPKFELLLREYHNGKVLPPASVLEIADFNGINQDIDYYVISLLAENFSNTFGENGEHIDSVSINISGDTLVSPQFRKMLVSTFREFNIPFNKIVLEVKENVINSTLSQAMDVMHALKQEGFQLAQDDIGVGSSNFKNMFLFPVDFYKIDRSYSEGMLSNRSVKAFIQIIIDEAKAQGKATIAEGVPDQEHLEILRNMGVDYSQSFITGMPKPLIVAPQLGSF